MLNNTLQLQKSVDTFMDINLKSSLQNGSYQVYLLLLLGGL